ncbi:MAG: hypothetical protein ACTSUV_00880 [Candidatus Ranarchaeia archaeon]
MQGFLEIDPHNEKPILSSKINYVLGAYVYSSLIIIMSYWFVVIFPMVARFGWGNWSDSFRDYTNVFTGFILITEIFLIVLMTWLLINVGKKLSK